MIHSGHNDHIIDIWLARILEFYRATDDVFRDDFLSGVIFTGMMSGKCVDVSPAANQLLESLGNSWIETLDTDNIDEIPPPAPYVTAGRHLLEIFRLYDDNQGAFMNGLVPARDL